MVMFWIVEKRKVPLQNEVQHIVFFSLFPKVWLTVQWIDIDDGTVEMAIRIVETFVLLWLEKAATMRDA